jgi:3-hydroxybutyryl-CoA dehydratase
MASSPHTTTGLYFEEFQLGQQIYTPARTVTESDITTFAGLSGDYNQIHTNAELAKTTPYGQRIAHGLLVLSVASGLAMRSGFLEGTVMAFREINEWKFIKPVFIGDTVHVEITILETKALPRIGGGAIVLSLVVNNQKDETVMKGRWTALVASRPSKPA